MRSLYLTAILLLAREGLAQVPFTPVAPSSAGDLLIPKELKYDLLFREGDTVVSVDGKKTLAKGGHDYNAFLGNTLRSDSEGMMYTSHEVNSPDTIIGDGGGGTIYRIHKTDGRWKPEGKYYSIDFSGVGETYNNCSGAVTPKGSIFTTEEFPPASNKDLFTTPWGPGFQDTSDYNGLKRYQNMGWVVEVNPAEKEAMHKLYGMGRFSHEGAWSMPDRKTVYLADDYFPSVFFKFVSSKEDDYTDGQLYAYKQSADENSGSWMALPMQMDSLVNIRDVALRMGATVFVRMEWITYVNGKLYITETGMDNFSMEKKKVFNGELPGYLKAKYSSVSNSYEYPFGGVLEFDPLTDKIRPYVYDGRGKADTKKHFANPDGISHCIMNGKSYLVINEDLISINKGRVDSLALVQQKYIPEIWWLDLSIQNPSVDDLYRFLVGPSGSETTGGYFSPDYSTYFVNVQHPDNSNKYPFNKSATIAITGFKLPDAGKPVKKKKKK